MQAICLCGEFNFGAMLATPKWIPHGMKYDEEPAAMYATCWWQSSADAAQSCSKRKPQYTTVIAPPNPQQIVYICAKVVVLRRKHLPALLRVQLEKHLILQKANYGFLFIFFCLGECCVQFSSTTTNRSFQ